MRINAQTNNASFDPVAFINSPSNAVMPGRWVTVVDATMAGSFTLVGLPTGTYGIKYTTGGQYNIDLPDQTLTSGQTLSTTIPAAGVLTVFQK